MLLHLLVLCSANGATLPIPYAACTCAVDPLAGLLCRLLGAGADAAVFSFLTRLKLHLTYFLSSFFLAVLAGVLGSIFWCVWGPNGL